MAAKKQKYYVVWRGHKPGIYTSWDQCLQQVKNYPAAEYKAFTAREEAEEAFRHGYVRGEKKPVEKKASPLLMPTAIDMTSISVDAACSGNPGIMEYRGVYTADGTEIFRVGPFQQGTNNIGEFLALVHALALLEKQGDMKTTIYSDSRTAMAWVNRKKANTKLPRNPKTAELFNMIVRAERWLKDHTWSNPIKKWETEHWGEIPADFGRK